MGDAVLPLVPGPLQTASQYPDTLVVAPFFGCPDFPWPIGVHCDPDGYCLLLSGRRERLVEGV